MLVVAVALVLEPLVLEALAVEGMQLLVVTDPPERLTLVGAVGVVEGQLQAEEPAVQAS